MLAVVAMERALITRDFTVAFVHDNGSSRTPALFNVATLWSALEGSILLWALILAGFTRRTSPASSASRLRDPLVGWALLDDVRRLRVLLPADARARPTRSAEVAVPAGYDGPGPNPLLQNHILMAFHPPMLYLGYVGFTVPFAFAIAALATGRLGEGWLVETRAGRSSPGASSPSASSSAPGGATRCSAGAATGPGTRWRTPRFLPWLTGTAYLHSVMVQERRGMLRVWNLSLLCATFALTILGTFLTRSGVLESVHAFSDGDIGAVAPRVLRR